ncbi:EAL domain-containing protein [Temperatibacter marinus]|uniref:EAL domain-containing protein n=1 Tax=Temperatibacter marinus TaxID=1456591 RepID=A0AA52EI14_9PROT|nr:EAL domain-containing protein [Temperatibacter marinus]WND03160.1 EAL domain-containing protein [Temperatibacter marinus]
MEFSAIDEGAFKSFLKAMADVILEIDSEDIIQEISWSNPDLLGRMLQKGDSLQNALHPDDLPLFTLLKRKLNKQRKIGPAPFRIVKENQKEIAVNLYGTSHRKDGVIYYQLMLRPYAGDLVLPSLSQRPASRPDRQFTTDHFNSLSKRVSDYADGLNISEGQALLKLAGFFDEDQPPLNERILKLSKLLIEAATDRDDPRKVDVSSEIKAVENKPDIQQSFDNALKTNTNFLRIDSITGDDGLSEEEAVKAAVFSLQQASRGGKSNSLTGVSGDYEKRLQKAKMQLRAFKTIVTQEYFDIALQPIVHIETGKLHHYEALCRFDHRVYDGSPYFFMCFAEEMGVIHEFDLAMTLKVIHLIKRLKRIGYNISVAVNISGKSIQSSIFLRHFFRILEDCDDIRKNLSFELTESSQIDDLETTNKILSRIREFGHIVCLDDFGAGAAGLQYLRALKVDVVKIDGVYIRKGIEEEENRSFLRSMADLCTKLNITTVGECVEDEKQKQFLQDIGVTYAQGWLYGKPVSVSEALENY